MKNLISNSIKLFTLVGCVFVMFSCGSNECQTCTMEGETSVELCEDDYPSVLGVGTYEPAILAQEALGFTCTKN